jgi:hypothetical protein
MAQSPKMLARAFAVVWCAAVPLATARCARHKPAAPAPAPSPTLASDTAPLTRAPVTLRVTNSNWSDVRIYLVRGTMWVRLGIVTTNSTIEFTIPADLLSGATSVTLVADPVAATGRWATALPVISPGDEFELVVETYLQYSHLVVR